MTISICVACTCNTFVPRAGTVHVCMGVFAIRVGTGLAIVTVIAAPVFLPALQHRAVHVSPPDNLYATVCDTAWCESMLVICHLACLTITGCR